MADNKYTEIDAVDHSGKPVVIFDTTNEGRTVADFRKVMDKYNESNGYRLPASFTVLPKGSFTQRARSMYETVNQRAQHGAQQIGELVGGAALTSPALLLGQKLGIVPQGTAEGLSGKGAQIGEGVAEVATAPFKTPEAGMGTIGNIAGLATTRKMSTLPQMIGAGAGTFAGLQAAKPLFGGQSNVPMDIAESLISMAGTGVFGAAQSVFGKTLSNRAQAAFGKEMNALMESELAHLGKDPAAVRAFFSTPEGVDRLIQSGTKLFRQDLDDLSNNIIKAVNNRPPATLSRSSASQLRNLAEQLFDAGDNYLQVIGDRGNSQAARRVMADIHGQMQEVLRTQYSNANQKKGLADVINDLDNAMFAHRKYLESFRGSEEVIGALSRSKDKQGHVTPKRFQEEIAKYYHDNPGSLLEAAGKLTQRGGPGLTVAGDKSVLSGNIPIPTPRVMGNWRLPVGPLGQSYTGNVISPTQQALSVLGQALGSRAATGQVKPAQ